MYVCFMWLGAPEGEEDGGTWCWHTFRPPRSDQRLLPQMRHVHSVPLVPMGGLATNASYLGEGHEEAKGEDVHGAEVGGDDPDGPAVDGLLARII